jgi:hypothetical protein
MGLFLRENTDIAEGRKREHTNYQLAITNYQICIF